MQIWSELGNCKIVDLSVTVSESLPSGWPPHIPFTVKTWNYFTELFERQGEVKSIGPYQTRFWVIDEHCGTHFDAPTHFIPPPDSGLPWAGEMGLQNGDLVPLKDLSGPAVTMDLRVLSSEGKPGESPWIRVEHVKGWEDRHGPVQPGDVVLFFTGWDQYYVRGPEGDAYCLKPLMYKQGPGWPAPDVATVCYLYDRGVRCLGIDSPSMGATHDGAPVHHEGLSRGMRYIEMLTGLGSLPSRGAYFIFLPVKVAGSTGGPGRAIALLP